MAKINKVYPPFFNGVSQQKPELILDNQCKEMINCVPDLVLGLTKRPPAKHVRTITYTESPEMEDGTVFHSYDRGEDDEEYIFVETGNTSHPIHIFKKDGTEMTVAYNATNETAIKNYLANGGLKGLTVQDRTWIFSKNATVSLDYSATSPLDANYENVAYYWIKRGSGDVYNPFNYAVYLNGTAYDCEMDDGVSGTEPITKYATVEAADPDDDGIINKAFEDSDYAAEYLKNVINTNASGFVAEAIGSIIKIRKTDYSAFTFSSWDSWGNQASEGWQGSVNKISDLPKEMPFSNVYVRIIGDETNTFTDYYVKWNGSSWEECLDPAADRGALTSMPVKLDRTALVGGIATFTFDLVDWSEPRVGNIDNNPNPSFVDRKISDLFFYKNRLGIASEDSVTLTETANYTNFYATTVVDIVDTDVIDITIATNQASKIYHVTPFNNSLYIFTKYAQYELVAEGVFSPSTVSMTNTTNYPMATDVAPVVVNDSLFFVSTTDNKQQLREYIKTDTLAVKGIDLNVSTPTYLEKPVKKLVANGVLGQVLCCTNTNTIYLYNFKEDGTKRIQSAWSTWELLNGLTTTTDSYEYGFLGSSVIVVCKTASDYRYHLLQLDYEVADDNIDTSSDGTTETEYAYISSVVLPDYYPQIGTIRTPKNKMLIKKVTIEGEGSFDATVYRKDYDTTYTKYHDKSLRDLDLHVASKVGNAEITIKDVSSDDFTISSIVVEGLYSPTSREMK
jgi:hypothetical protein